MGLLKRLKGWRSGMKIRFFGGPYDGQTRAVNEDVRDSISVLVLDKIPCGHYRREDKIPSAIPMHEGVYKLKCLYGGDRTFYLYVWAGTSDMYLDPTDADVINMLIDGYQPAMNL